MVIATGRDLKAARAFTFCRETDEFDAAFTRTLAKELHAITTQHLPERNTHRYNHGSSWHHHADEAGDPGKMETHSAEMMIRFEDVVLGDERLVLNQIKEASETFHRQFMQMLYRTVSETCDRTGNVVSQRDHPNFPQAYLQMLRSIEFGVDRDGKVSIPEMHLDTKTMEKVIPELEAQPQAFRDEVDSIIQLKHAEALEREALRVARFKSAA